MPPRRPRAESPTIDPVLSELLNRLGKAANSNGGGGIYAALREVRQALDGVTDPLRLESIRAEIVRQLVIAGQDSITATRLAAAVFKPEPRGDAPAPEPARASLNAGDRDLTRSTSQAWHALTAANTPPALFRRGSSIWRLEDDDEGRPVLRRVNEDALRRHLAESAHWWIAPDRGGVQDALPPMPVVKNMLADPHPPLPRAPRITGAPVFSPQGGLLSAPGYHEEAAIYYHAGSHLVVPRIPETPTDDDIAHARSLLVDELLWDFPFVGEAERAHALAFFLQPFLRDLIDGATPLYVFEKPSAGTGATLLVEALAFPSLGHPPDLMTVGRDRDEWRKRITATLSGGASVVVFDNVDRLLDSSDLCSAITATVWSDRRLGTNDMLQVPVRCTWAITANNVRLSNQVARRTVRIRLDAKVERAWQRTGFKHFPLMEWIAAHRGELMWAALVAIQAWLRRGRPEGPARPLGGFESWTRVLGGVLHVLGVRGFLGNLDELYDLSDVEGAENRRFVAAWWTQHRSTEVGVNELFTLATSDEVDLDLDAKTERGQRTQLGVRLTSMRDHRYTLTDETGEFTVQVVLSRMRQGARRWRLASDPEKGSPGSPESPQPSKSGPSGGEPTREPSNARLAGGPQGHLWGTSRDLGSPQRSSDSDQQEHNLPERGEPSEPQPESEGHDEAGPRQPDGESG